MDSPADPRPGASDDVHLFPVMHNIPALVKRPDGFLRPPAATKHGRIAIGAAAMPEVGGCLFIGVQTADGEFLVATLPANLLDDLAAKLRHAVEQLITGDFDAPESGRA